MHRLTEIIRHDMVPALGVTEPGATAFASAKVRTLLDGNLKHLYLPLPWAMSRETRKNSWKHSIRSPHRTWKQPGLLSGTAESQPG